MGVGVFLALANFMFDVEGFGWVLKLMLMISVVALGTTGELPQTVQIYRSMSLPLNELC